MVKAGPSRTNKEDWVVLIAKGLFPSQNNQYLGRKLDPEADDPPVNSLHWSVWKVKEMYERLIVGLGVPRAEMKRYISRVQRNSNAMSHAHLKGVCDPTGMLPMNCVFITGAVQDGEGRRTTFGRFHKEVFITRSPCMEPKDAKILKVVGRKPAEMPRKEWNFLRSRPFGHVIFPTATPEDTGYVPLSSLVGNGDLDGDDYFVLWDKGIMEHLKKVPPRARKCLSPLNCGNGQKKSAAATGTVHCNTESSSEVSSGGGGDSATASASAASAPAASGSGMGAGGFSSIGAGGFSFSGAAGAVAAPAPARAPVFDSSSASSSSEGGFTFDAPAATAAAAAAAAPIVSGPGSAPAAGIGGGSFSFGGKPVEATSAADGSDVGKKEASTAPAPAASTSSSAKLVVFPSMSRAAPKNPFASSPSSSSTSSTASPATGNSTAKSTGRDTGTRTGPSASAKPSAWLEAAQGTMLDLTRLDHCNTLIGKLYGLCKSTADQSSDGIFDEDACSFGQAYKDSVDIVKHGGKISLPIHLHDKLPKSVKNDVLACT
eukprot:CAMPEP_0181042688 /NCGR_PEP_ID=MMETSP1070-20121207/12290_1 /TAXON_ID=265543 /ORGANISM="Minutocellus polymorphus, Strain NH13" /LENGTH=543 /DNA_ID=CAMNT_0023120931 /DNA_START=183 /DNA_END=1814 /DNA_ORIENTATION=+